MVSLTLGVSGCGDGADRPATDRGTEPPTTADGSAGSDAGGAPAVGLSQAADTLAGLYSSTGATAHFTECSSGRSWAVAGGVGADALASAQAELRGGGEDPVGVEVTAHVDAAEPGLLVIEGYGAVVLADACPGGATPLRLEDTEWVLTSVLEAPVPANAEATLRLESVTGRALGSTGCNSYSGGYELVGARLRFGALGLTRMACPRGAEGLEEGLMEVFRSTGSFEVSVDTLRLLGEAGVLARWIAR